MLGPSLPGFVAGSPRQLAAAEPAVVWSPPDVGALPRDRHGESVRLGRDIFSATYAQIGPSVADPAKRFAGNNLACGNCHLQAGTKRFGLPVYGLAKDFPQYSTRSGVEITLADRVNACMQRSMNGRPLPAGSPELAAVVAYLGYLSTGRPEGYSGYGAGNMPELDRPADPTRGAAAYKAQCTLCHAGNGEGLLRAPGVPELGYMVPPLWGDDSFNTGAGMNRLITAANFLHSNMPHGADFLNPALSMDEAWDIAAFVLSQRRPQERGRPLISPIS